MSREFRFLATEFVACSKPQAEIIILKRSIQGCNNVPEWEVNPDYSIRVVATKALVLLATISIFGNSQKDSLSLLIMKKISFLASRQNIYFL